MNLTKNQKIGIVVAIVLFLLISQNQTTDKKEGNPFSSISGGLMGVVIGGVLWATGAVTGLVAGIIALIWGASSIGGGIWDWMHPPAAIPTWIYIAGFALLLFYIIKKK